MHVFGWGVPLIRFAPVGVALVVDQVRGVSVWGPLDDAGLALLAVKVQGALVGAERSANEKKENCRRDTALHPPRKNGAK